MLKRSNFVVTRRPWAALIAAGFAAALPWTVVAQSSGPSPASDVVSVTPPPKVVKPRQRPKPARIIPSTKPPYVVTAKPPIAPGRPADLATTIAPPPPALIATARPGMRQAVGAKAAPRPAVNPTMAIPGMGAPAAPSTDVAVATLAAPPVDPTRFNEGVFELTVDKDKNVTPLSRTVSIKLVKANLESALVQLLSESQVNFVIRAKIKDEKVTCGFTDSRTVNVLQHLLDASDQALTYTVEGDVVMILNKG